MDRSKLGKLLAAFLRARPRLEAAAQARAGSRAAAKDLLQDAWLKLEARGCEAGIDNPEGFITQVAQNTVTDHLRKERRRGAIDAELTGILWEGVEQVSPERTAMGRERLRAVCAALEQLPERTRRIFLMNRLGGVPHRKIAEKLGISDQAVYYHIRRALEHLAALRDEDAD